MSKLKVGQKAPEFNLPGSDGKTHQLSDYQGKNVVLYFYPKDDTPGWTVQADGFSTAHKDYKNHNAVILGVSMDSLESHDKFIEKFGITYVLLSDEEKTTLQDYGVFEGKDMEENNLRGFHRSTFLIDGKGILRKIYEDVDPKGNPDEVLKDIKAMNE